MFITTKLRHRAATIALAVTIGLTGFKLAVGYVSGSVGVISEGIHSFLDLISAAVAFFTIREAGKPADEQHPFGHGKFETLSSLLESLLLVAAAAWIVVEAIDHIKHPQPLQYEGLAIFTIAVSLVVSYWTYRHNIHAAKETESSAIHVNALHFLADVVASAGVLMGLLLLKFTGWQMIDPIVAFGVAAYISAISLKQVKQALSELTDTQLPMPEVSVIRGILKDYEQKHCDEIIEAHDLRTRKSGANRHIDFHLVVCGQLSVNESHSVCDEMETEMITAFPGSSVNIHVEPCAHENTVCREACPYRQKTKGRARS